MPQWEAPNGGGTADDDESESEPTGTTDDQTTTGTGAGTGPQPTHPEPGVDDPDEDEETEPPDTDTEPGPEPEDKQEKEEESVDDATARDDEVGEQARDLRQQAIEETGIDPEEHDDVTAADLIRVRRDDDRLVTEATDFGQRFFARRHVMDEEGFAPDEFELQEVDDGFVVETTDVFDERLREEVGGEFADVVDPAEREEGFDTTQFFDAGPGADVTDPGGQTPERATIDVAPRPVEEEQTELPDGPAATAESPAEREAGFADAPLTEEVAEARFEHHFGHDDFEVQETDDGFQAVVESESEPTREEQFIDSATDAGRQAFGIATIPASAAFDQLPDGVEREAFALATMPPRLVGEQVFDDEDDRTAVRDATMAAAAAGVVSPEPVTTVGGGAILGGAALAAGTAQRTEIEIDPMQEFGHAEVEVPEEQEQAEITAPADGVVHGAELQPADEFGTAEVDVPAEQQETDPQTVRTEQMAVGQRFVREQQDEDRVVEEEDTSVIVPEEFIPEETVVIGEIEEGADETTEGFEDEPAERFWERTSEEPAEDVTEVEEPADAFEEAREQVETVDETEPVAAEELARQQQAQETVVDVETVTGAAVGLGTIGAEELAQDPMTDVDVAEDIDTDVDVDVATDVAEATDVATEVDAAMAEAFAEVTIPALDAAVTTPATATEVGYPEPTIDEVITETGGGEPTPTGLPDLTFEFGDDVDGSRRPGRGFAGERVEFDVQDARELDAEIESELAGLEDELDDALGGM